MKIEAPIKGMTVNRAWQGKRYKTKQYKQYEKEFFYSTRNPINPIEGEVIVLYVFYLKYYGRTDVGNLEKPLSDLITKKGFIEDDRYIKSLNLIKKRVKNKKDQKIEIIIEPYSEEGIEKVFNTIYTLDKEN